MNLFKKAIILVQALAFFTFLPTLSMANSWVDTVEITEDFKKLFYTQTQSAEGGKTVHIHYIGGKDTYINFKTPSTSNVVFSAEGGPKRKTLFKFTDTGKKLTVGKNSYYLFRFENKFTKTTRCFYMDRPGAIFFGVDIKISKKEFYPKACRVGENILDPFDTGDAECIEVKSSECG